QIQVPKPGHRVEDVSSGLPSVQRMLPLLDRQQHTYYAKTRTSYRKGPNMTMLRKSSLGLAVTACLLISGCHAAKPQVKYRIAVVPKGTSHDFWKSIHAGAIQGARERGNTQILWEGPPKESMRYEQQQIIERFVSEGVSAIVLAPCDRKSLVPPVEGALKKGIPVVIIDSGLESSPLIEKNDHYLGYVATDNRQGGVEAAQRIIELLKDKEHPKVLMIRYQTGSESTEQREAGFRDT